METSYYEARRKANILDNQRILREIGLLNPFKNQDQKLSLKVGVKRKSVSAQPKPKRPCLEERIDTDNCGSIIGSRRKSARIQGQPSQTKEEINKDVEDWQEEGEGTRHIPVAKNRPNSYGVIEGVDIGASWATRMECCRDLIHRPPVSGIHGGPEGAYSIALSGGYDDNVDWGECFTYTGEGGRDLKGTKSNPKNLRMAPQSKDQTLTRGNLALSLNVETGQPVRVIRGYKLSSHFAPEEGYRYDGLYTVEKAWFTSGLSGFMVWKFALRRCEHQAPPPWHFTEAFNQKETENEETFDQKETENEETFDQKETENEEPINENEENKEPFDQNETKNEENKTENKEPFDQNETENEENKEPFDQNETENEEPFNQNETENEENKEPFDQNETENEEPFNQNETENEEPL